MPPEHAGSFKDARRLFSHVLKRRGLFVRACAMLLFGALLQLAFPKGAELLVDGTLKIGDPRFHNLNLVCGALLGIVAIVLISRYLEMCWFQELGERGVADLRSDTFDHLARLPMSWFSDKRAADLSSRILADLSQIQEMWIFDLRALLSYASVLVGAGVLLVVTSWELAAVALAVAPVVIVLAWLIGPKIRRQSTLTQQKLAAGAVVVEESIQGIQNVKSCATERFESARFRRAMADYLIPAIRGGRTRSLFVSVVVFALLATWVYMMWHGSWMIREGRLTPGEFTGFMFYLAFAGTAAGVLAESFAKFQRALGAHSRIIEILDAPPENLGSGAADLPRLRGSVAFQDVHFRYPSRPDSPALHGISFSAEPGECIALVGPSGAGKSTVAALLCRLYEAHEGAILFDGKPASSFPLGWLRAQMAFVPQEVLLFGGTVGENIAYGRENAITAEIESAARRANAFEFIQALPQAFDTVVGDRGAQLSGGQRQRIALARAILKDPAILVLDEATSALDAESEALIQAALDEIMRQRTTFIIAHRLSTVRRADRILVLHEGLIVESGTHDQLFAAKGAYWHLCARQFQDS